MRIIHDTRDSAYCAPSTVLERGASVDLTVEIWDAPSVSVTLRTWIDGEGEGLFPLDVVDEPGGADGSDAPTRFHISFTPNAAGYVWYQFIITDAQGTAWRYGARGGQVDGDGQLVTWEPPSFLLTVYESAADLGQAALSFAGLDAADERAADFLCNASELQLMLQDALGGIARTDAASFASFRMAPINGDVLALWADGAEGSSVCALLNRSFDAAYDVAVPCRGAAVSELVDGYDVPIVDAAAVATLPHAAFDGERFARVQVRPRWAAVAYFHPEHQLERPTEPGMGVLAHITSLPAGDDGGRGVLGPQAYAFIDWLAQAGVKYWQVLPVNPTDGFGSPYAGISAFAGNPDLLDAQTDGFDLAVGDDDAYQAFCDHEGDWLDPFACFMAIREKMGTHLAWQDWPEEYRRYQLGLLDADEELAASAERYRRAQFAFERQWSAVRAYANERGVKIIGDMPIYVNGNSADVWASPQLFQLGPDGRPQVVAGCPPDPFAVEGQVWGNPLYDWDGAAEGGYAWWLRRLERAFDLYDLVRLDHFIGFARYFSIPSGEHASKGTYYRGPGLRLFREAWQKFGPLPIIAEDLGSITPAVRALSASCGFMGMDIVQFVDGGDPLAGYYPRPGKIAYTGTHDNQTLVGYVRCRYPHLDAVEVAKRLAREVASCPAPIAVVPLQDLMLLGDEARMNVPGVADGNWTWQAQDGAIEQASAFTRELVELRGTVR